MEGVGRVSNETLLAAVTLDPGAGAGGQVHEDVGQGCADWSRQIRDM